MQSGTAYPCLVMKTEKSFDIYVQRKKICHSKYLKEAITLMLSAYWVFDLQFHPSLKNSLGFICYLCEVPQPKRSILLQKLMN